MAKINNDKSGGSHGFAQVDLQFQPPGTVFPDPGKRTDTDSDWVRRDMLYKASLPRPKYY